MLQYPKFSLIRATAGMSVPTYAYAQNNPLHYTDPDGNCATTYDCCVEKAIAAGRDPKASCGDGPENMPNPKYDACRRTYWGCTKACDNACVDPSSTYQYTKWKMCHAICEIALAACMVKGPIGPN